MNQEQQQYEPLNSQEQHYSLIVKSLELNPAREKNILENFFSLEVDDLLDFVKSEGVYQQLNIISFFYICFVIGFSYNLMSYAFVVPDFYCYDKFGELQKKDQGDINNCKYGYVLKVERTSLISIYGYYGQQKQSELVIAQSLIFFLGGFGCFFLTFLSDVYGRKKMILCSFIIGFIGATVMLFVHNFWAQIFGIICAIAYGDGFFNIAAVFIGETMGQYYRSFTNSLNFFAYTAGVIIILFISFYLRHFESLMIVLFIIVITCFFFLPVMRETPFYYFQKGKLKKMYNSLNHILNVNYHRDSLQIKQEQLQEKLQIKELLQEEYSQFQIEKKNIKDRNFLMTYIDQISKEDLKNIIYLIFGGFPFYFSGSTIGLGPQFVGINNFYVNLFTSYLGDLIGYSIMSKYSYKVKRIKFLKLVLIGYTFMGILLVLIKLSGQRETLIFQYFQLLITFGFKLFSSQSFCIVYILFSELFKTNLRGFAAAVIVFGNKILSMSVSTNLHFSIDMKIHPLTINILVAPISFLLIRNIPETLNAKMKN